MWCHTYIPLGINPNFFGLSLCERQIVYALRTRTPVEARRLLPRLACVRPAASVHPEPGSNSSSLKSLISSNRLSYWLQVSLNSLNLLCAVQHYVNVRVVLSSKANCYSPLQMSLSSHLRVQRYGVFLILQIFSQVFFKFFYSLFVKYWLSAIKKWKFSGGFCEKRAERAANWWNKWEC